MECTVLRSDEFTLWWESLTEAEQEDIDVSVQLLERFGVLLDYPYSSAVHQSKYPHLRELRVQHGGKPYRVLYAFDPNRDAVLLIGGNKMGKDNKWYKQFVPMADKIYDRHLQEIQTTKR
jgi:hypothetical protein